MIVFKSCMLAKEWNAETLPVNKALLDLAAVARVAERKRQILKAKLEEEARIKMLQQKVIFEVEKEKKTDAEMSTLNKKAEETENDIKKKNEERRKIQKLLDELQAATRKYDAEIEELHREKVKIGQKKDIQTSKIVKTVIKRHVVDLDEGSSHQQDLSPPIPKISKK